jgi:hypothetical protein
MIKVKRCKIKSKEKMKISDTKLDLDCLFPGNGARKRGLLTVDYHIKVHMDFASGQIHCRSQGTLLPSG